MEMTSVKTLLKALLGIFLLTGSIANGQERLSEAEVNLQKIFIDANREKVLGNYDNAEYLYKEVLDQDKKNHAAAYELARVFAAQEEEEKALKYINIAIESDPNNEWYQQFQADVFQKLGKNEEAALVYEKLTRQFPNNEYYYYKWAYFLVRANDINKAVKVYDELESITGINEEIIRRKHSLYLGTGNHKKAAKELLQLVEAFPENVEYQHLLAGFYEQIGDQEAAKSIYQKILELEPGNVKAKLALTSANYEGQSEIKFLNSLKPIFSDPNVDIDTKIQKLIPFINKVADKGELNLANAAIELTDILEEVHPDEAKVYSASGDLHFYSGQPEKAQEKYKKTLELDDSVFLVWQQLMYLYFESENFEALAEISEEAIDLFPNQAMAYYFGGLANNRLAKYKAALDLLNQGVLMSGRNGRLKLDIQVERGVAYMHLKNYEAGAAAYEKALELDRNNPDALNGYSLLLSEQGTQLEKAKALAKQANEILPGRYKFQATQGWVAYKMKEFEEAKKMLNKALKGGGEDDPEVLEKYGDLLFQLGQNEEALTYWKKALDLGSTSELLEKKITDKQLYE